jgi:hypothetical protein
MGVLVRLLVALFGAAVGAAIGVALTYWLLYGQGVSALVWVTAGVFFSFPGMFAGAVAAGLLWQRFFPVAFRDDGTETTPPGRYGIGASVAYGVGGSAALVVLVVMGWLAIEHSWSDTSSSSSQYPSLTGKLCKKPGVRYDGTTAEGVRVCFTLTSDRSTWVEIAWRFRGVGTSRCPGGATRVSFDESDGNGGPRGFTEPGFTATIHGVQASGVLTDSELCPGKKFTWSAREAASS